MSRHSSQQIYLPRTRDPKMCDPFDPRVVEMHPIQRAGTYNRNPEWQNHRFQPDLSVQYRRNFHPHMLHQTLPAYFAPPDLRPWNSSNTIRHVPPFDCPYQRQLPPPRPLLNQSLNETHQQFTNSMMNRSGDFGHGPQAPVELQVSNLDQNIAIKDMKQILSTLFLEHVRVLHLSVFAQSDGNHAAYVKVPTLQEAQFAISQLHRRKIGYKRILISYTNEASPDPQVIRSHIVMLLQEVPGYKLPLFKFREMLESRFMISVSISEIYKFKDVCIITEDSGGRMVALHPDHCNTPSPRLGNTSEGNFELPYCTIHAKKPWPEKGWAEQEIIALPNVRIPLDLLRNRTHQLLISHDGHLPLASFPNCYYAQFNDNLEIDENGVPLEHLLTCFPTVELKQSFGCIKYLTWSEEKSFNDSSEESKCHNSPLANQMALFSRELVDLLKTVPHCQLVFNRFIPAYHHHFGRQCRVADYGFTKLIDLLEALSHTVQVTGEGNKRLITLSHRAQVRRFTSDLLRILKAQASKQIVVSEFANVYHRVLGKPFDVVDYGVCELEDILNEIPENIIGVTSQDNEKIIAIPKRERTPEEISRTKKFAFEVVELLRHAPQNQMLFNKFVPSYHHHFGHQCRVSDYGFTKLIELLEAIPEYVKIEECADGEKRIAFTKREGLRILGEQIMKLVNQSGGYLKLSNVAQEFVQIFGYAVHPEFFGCTTLIQLIRNLHNHVKVIHTESDDFVIIPAYQSRYERLILQCRRILMGQPNHRLKVEDFQKFFHQFYNENCDIEEIGKKFGHVAQFITMNGKKCIELTPFQILACNVHQVLVKHEGLVTLSEFDSAYFNIMGFPCIPSTYGFPTLIALLQNLHCTVILRTVDVKQTFVCLNEQLEAVGFPLPFDPPAANTRGVDSSNESTTSDASSMRFDFSSVSMVDESTSWDKNLRSCWSHESSSDWLDQNRWSAFKARNWLDLESTRKPQYSGRETQRTYREVLGNSVDTSKNTSEDSLLSSVWSSPSPYSYEESAKVDLPSSSRDWPEMSEKVVSNLLSPTKNLLPATRSPLSKYFPAPPNRVVAPHPSELPLPTMPIASVSAEKLGAPKKSGKFPENEEEHTPKEASSPSEKAPKSRKSLASQFEDPSDV